MRAWLLPLLAILAQSLQVDPDGSEVPAGGDGPTLKTEGTSSWFPPLSIEGKAAGSYPRKGTVNLNLPPKMRWMHIMMTHRREILPFFAQWQDALDRHPDVHQDAWATAIEGSISDEYLQELRGILPVLQAGGDNTVTWTNLLLFQAMYDIGSSVACSQVIVAARGGIVLHGRNLDYRMPSPFMEITFLKNGEPVIVAPTFLGLVGVYTGIRTKQWSFGLNARSSEDTVKSALAELWAGGEVLSLLVRKLMEEDSAYGDAVTRLSEAHLLRAAYLVIGGAGSYEGAVISRDARPRWVWHPGLKDAYDMRLSPLQRWIFQTNDDLDSPAKDERRAQGQMLFQFTDMESITPLQVLEVMRTKPVYMSDQTLFTAVMAPKTGQLCSVLGEVQKGLDDTSVDTGVCALSGWER